MSIEPIAIDESLTVERRPCAAPAHCEEDADESLDRELLRRIAQHRDKVAMRRLYQRYRRRLCGFLRRLTRDDALIDEAYNDVMLKVWDKAHQFRADARVSSWLYAIAYRDCLRMLKRQKTRLSVLDRLRREPMPVATDASRRIEDADLIAQGLDRLSAAHRLVVELAYFEGYSTAEISEIAGCPVNTVKTRMHHARARLRDYVEKATLPRGLQEVTS